MNLTVVREHPFQEGVQGVNNCIHFLETLSMLVPDSETQKYENYLSAIRRFLPLCSEFIELIHLNKNFYMFRIFKEFMFKYPKSKQNLANPKQITTAFIEFYIRYRQQKVKNFVKERDDGVKFLYANTNNIYNTLVVYTNLIRASSVICTINTK